MTKNFNLSTAIHANLTFHHTGVLVSDINEAIKNYTTLLGENAVSEIQDIDNQNILVCFVALTPNVYIELIQPKTGNTNFDKFFKKGINFYHIGFLCQNFDAVCGLLQDIDFKLINTFTSSAFGNKRCSFFMSNELHIIEIIETEIF